MVLRLLMPLLFVSLLDVVITPITATRAAATPYYVVIADTRLPLRVACHKRFADAVTLLLFA